MAADASLDAIQAGTVPPVDETAKLEEDEFVAEAKQLELDRQKADLESRIQDTKLRGRFTRRIFVLIVVWLVVVLVILLFEGFHATVRAHNFQLSDNVLLALIGSTTANVLGVFIIVVHYLFPETKA